MIKKYFDENLQSKILKISNDLMKISNEEVKPTKLVEKFQNCFKSINTIIELQKDYSFVRRKLEESNVNRKIHLTKLLDSFTENGLTSKLSIQDSQPGNGFGIFATESINKYDQAMTIPVDKMITECEAYSSQFGLFLSSDALTKNRPNISLALYLLNECFETTSMHSDYIDGLPVQVDTFLYLTPDDVAMLRHSQYIADIVKQFCNICCHYCYFFRLFVQTGSSINCLFKDVFCFEDFRWAVSIVMSRNNAIPSSDGQSRILALIPIWDMMNHKAGEVTTDFDDDKQSLVFYSMSSYQENDEIFMDYGDRTNFHYFMFSGFIPEYNEYDTYKLKIGFNKQDPLYKDKKHILSKLSIDCDDPTFDIDYRKSVMINERFRLYLSVMLIKDAEVLERFSTSLDVQADILKYCGSVEKDISDFVKTRIVMNKSCFSKALELALKSGSMAAILLKYEEMVSGIIAAKCE